MGEGPLSLCRREAPGQFQRMDQMKSEETAKTAKPIAYLTGMYPKVSHTFILREIAALRDLGAEVLPCSVRRPPPDELRGPEVEAECARTFFLLQAARNPLRLARANLRIILTAARLWGRAA
jgi:hypothetical protein